jgi:hypothetical protein
MKNMKKFFYKKNKTPRPATTFIPSPKPRVPIMLIRTNQHDNIYNLNWNSFMQNYDSFNLNTSKSNTFLNLMSKITTWNLTSSFSVFAILLLVTTVSVLPIVSTFSLSNRIKTAEASETYKANNQEPEDLISKILKPTLVKAENLEQNSKPVLVPVEQTSTPEFSFVPVQTPTYTTTIQKRYVTRYVPVQTVIQTPQTPQTPQISQPVAQAKSPISNPPTLLTLPAPVEESKPTTKTDYKAPTVETIAPPVQAPIIEKPVTKILPMVAEQVPPVIEKPVEKVIEAPVQQIVKPIAPIEIPVQKIEIKTI